MFLEENQKPRVNPPASEIEVEVQKSLSTGGGSPIVQAGTAQMVSEGKTRQLRSPAAQAAGHAAQLPAGPGHRMALPGGF